jgi:hypothetical protein
MGKPLISSFTFLFMTKIIDFVEISIKFELYLELI